MAKSKPLTLEQVQAIIDDPDLNIDELREVMQECFGVTIPEGMAGETLASFVYKTYQEKAQEIADTRSESKKKRTPKRKRGTSPETASSSSGADADGNVSRAAFVVGIIQREGETTRRALEQALDDAFHYAKAGKSPRTRVNRVLKTLKQEGKIELEGGNVKWIG